MGVGGVQAVRLAVVCIGVGSLCAVASGQALTPDVFGMASHMGMASPMSTRHLGMGAPMACVNDRQFVNPAFAALQEANNVGLRITTTDLGWGPDVTSFAGFYTHPLTPGRDGLQIKLIALDGSGDGAMLQGVGGVRTEMSEEAFIVDYGRRIDNRLCLGLSILGYDRQKFGLMPAAGPALADMSAKARYGVRVDAAYEWGPGGCLGLFYSHAENSVDAEGLIIAPAGHHVFHSEQFAVGISGAVADNLTGMVEYQYAGTDAGAVESSCVSWHFGAEYELDRGWALRAGLADDSPTFGMGYTGSNWTFEYAYINDWQKDALEPLFGSSDTHSVRAIWEW